MIRDPTLIGYITGVFAGASALGITISAARRPEAVWVALAAVAWIVALGFLALAFAER